MTALLRLEAVNLAHTIDDTEDLSTRRGGGYMLLRAVRKVTKRFEGALAPISTGASIGLFAVEDGQDAFLLCAKVAEFLREVHPFRHATFTVAIATDDNLQLGVERCVARNRWDQMQGLSFATHWGKAAEVCATDEIRPAASHHSTAGQSVSLSVAARRHGKNGGRDLRQSFYATELEGHRLVDALPSFTDDLETLSRLSPSDPTFAPLSSNLDAKIAVFYADGNGFGSIQRGCATQDALQSWDDKIKRLRRDLLHDLLSWLASTPHACTADGALRLETLLWGGDEMLFVLPAWLGLEFAQRFFALTGGWAHAGQHLTHAAGLVFAHRGTPIRRLQHLAKELAQRAKNDGDTLRNNVAWLVLESFDTTADDIDTYWQTSGIATQGWQAVRLDTLRLECLARLEALKPRLPRSALIRALRSLAAGQGREELELLQNTYASTDSALDNPGRQIISEFWSLFGAHWQPAPTEPPSADTVPLTVLLTLWDYLLPAAPVTTSHELSHA